jgi:putative hemolysin
LALELYILFFIVLLCLSAFFSGSEIAYFSIKSAQIETLKLIRPFITERISRILKTPSRFLITVLISNTLVNITLAIFAALLTLSLVDYLHFNKTVSIVIEIFVVTIVLVVFGDVTPKIIARRFPLQFATFGAIPLSIIIVLISPLTYIFELMSKRFQLLLGVSKNKAGIETDEIMHLTEIVENQTHIDNTTKKIFQALGDFNYLKAKDIVQPRTDVISYNLGSSIENLIEVVKKNRSDVIIVYENNLDNIVGILKLIDLLPFYYQKKIDVSVIEQLLVKPIHIPETSPVLNVLKRFQLSRNRIAVVIDEHGGTTGVISLEDILNYLAGYEDISLGNLDYKKIDKNTFIFNSLYLLADVEKKIGQKLDNESIGISTIGGFVVHLFGHFPTVGDKMNYQNLKIEILELSGKRIKLVKIEKIAN